MARSRRDSRPTADIWPGFVDALSTLLLVIIFLLVVFVLAQFFLNQLLQGKDTQLQSLEQAVAELTEQLDLERSTATELRLSVSQLSSDLQGALADRDDTTASLLDAETERDELRDRMVLLEDEKSLLTQTLNDLRADTERNAALAAELERSTDIRARLQQELEQARQTVAADKETIELQLAQLVQLRRDIEALGEVRDQLELDVAEMATILQAAETAKDEATAEITRLADVLAAAQTATATLEDQVEQLSTSVTAADQETATLESEVARLTSLLSAARTEQTAGEQRVATLTTELDTLRVERGALDAEVKRLTEALAAAQADTTAVATLTAELEASRSESAERERRVAELAALLQERRAQQSEGTIELEELQRAREQLLVDLSRIRERGAALETELASERDRTTLAQRELAARDLRIEELLRSAGRSDEALATEQALSREALNQVEILNRQVNALRVQLAALEQALDLEQDRVEEQQVTIADLGSKLNVALAGKVEELSQFRSEFFGRLREVLGDRRDIRVVGDRFVFQSEVLFPTASAEIEPGGMDELRKLADSLRIISAEIPSDLPWVLQINGHTDSRTINTPDFPSNWELSTARAINVGKFLVRQGIPPARIAVAGFAQFQPLDDRTDEIAYRRNRRIEIKLTTR